MNTPQNYIARYQSLDYSMNHALLGFYVAMEVFRDFPSRLPNNVRSPLINGLRDFILMAKAAKDEIETNRNANGQGKHVSKVTMKPQSRGATAFIKTLIAQSGVGASGKPSFPFEAPIRSQYLFLALAYTDAFVTDSMSYMVESRPQILNKNDQISWKNILEFGSWDTLVSHMKSEHLTAFGFVPLEKRIEDLVSKYGVSIKADKADMNNFSEAILIRNSLIHNNGIISKHYTETSQIRKYNVGDTVTMSDDQVVSLIESIHNVCYEVFSGILLHFYKTHADKISGIMNRNKKS